jgi:serine/threonine protein kinase
MPPPDEDFEKICILLIGLLTWRTFLIASSDAASTMEHNSASIPIGPSEECAMPDAATHPTPQELAAFSQGKLPTNAEETVAVHLEKCPACRQAIEKMAPDSFIGKVRAAKPGMSSPPARPARPGDSPSLLPNRGASPAAPTDLPPALASYGKFRFMRELGRGGMGVVYQAEQTVMGRTVAVKVINPSVLAHPEALPRFQAEVRAAARLDHPNIVRAYDAEQVGDLHLLVMEFVEGKSLAEVVQQKGPLPIPHACHYIRQAALGLQHAFEQGMVHRDIKPQNLMVNARGQVKVLDFGLARMRSERKQGGGLTQADAFMGTPEYVSPEQATDARSADTRADVYSLGCTLFYLLTGRPPFQGETIVQIILAQIEKEAPPLQTVRPDVPAELSAVVARMLAKDPAQRFQQPIEVAQALAAFVKAGTKGGPRTGSMAPPGVASPRSGTVATADTSQINAVLRKTSAKSSSQEVPAQDEATSPLEKRVDAAAAQKNSKSARKAAKSSPAVWYRRWRVLACSGAAVVALGLGTWLLAAVILKTRVKTVDGEAHLVLEIDQPGAEVLVDGQKYTINVPGEEHPVEITALPGKRTLEVKKGGFKAYTREIELTTEKAGPIKVKLEPILVADALSLEEKWRRKVTALPVGQQVAAVQARLKECNPGFEGTLDRTIENGVVVELGIPVETISDISPVRALPGLQRLTLFATNDKGLISDLSQLQGMQLTFLKIDGCVMVQDLMPLKGMPLTYLRLGGCKRVQDLTPLTGMKLTELRLAYCHEVRDLTPLKGMPLTRLDLWYCGCTARQIRDLTPLKGLPLTDLCLTGCGDVRDVTPLEGMSLEEIRFAPPVVTKGLEVLRRMKTLKRIRFDWNKQELFRAEDFWKKYDAGDFREYLSTSLGAGDPSPKSPMSITDDFLPLFNGKDLTGWKIFGGGTGNWKVVDGVLIGSGPASHLFTERGDYENFHYRVEAMINDGGNSGQYFRTQFGPGSPKGYEAQINSTHKDTQRTGSLYGIVEVTEQLHKPDTWFTQEVIADGDHIIIKVDGKTVVDTHDPRYKKGHFALQQPDPGCVVKFRKIDVKELPASKSRDPAVTDPAVPRSPTPPGKSDLPPEAKATKAFEKSREEARAKLLAEFDAVLNRLAKDKGSTEQRLKLIDAVKEEKKRFENRGWIPWSEPMRPFLAKYFVSTGDAESKVRHAYNSLIDEQLRAKNESMVADLRADLKKLLGVGLMARWRVFRDGRPQGIFSLYSNGRINNINGNGTWVYSKGVLIYRWPDSKAPGGAWLDISNVSADGTTYAGTNNAPPGMRPKFSGVYVIDD